MDQKELKDDGRPKKFTLNEPCILLSIMGLSFLNGMSNTIIQKPTMDIVEFGSSHEADIYLYLRYAVIPVPGIILFALLTEFTGRKPVYIALSAMSVLTAVLECLPLIGKAILVANVVQATINGGLELMNMLCIPEYCRPKHRFLCLVVSQLVFRFGGTVASACMNARIQFEMYFGIIGIVLGLACLGCACFWPESPYWMAVRGRREDAAFTLRRLRGECAELSQISELRTPGSIKKIIFPLFCMLALASVVVFLNSLPFMLDKLRFYPYLDFEIQRLIIFVSSSCFLLLLTIPSYTVKRKTIYLTTAFVVLVPGYLLMIFLEWFLNNEFTEFSCYILTYLCRALFIGLEVLSYTWATEIIPQVKYNTVLACIFCVFTHLSFAATTLLLQTAYEQWRIAEFMCILVLTTMTVPGLLIGFFFTNETKGKTLFEIEESYLPKNTAIPEEAHDETVKIHQSSVPEADDISKDTNDNKSDIHQEVLPETTASPEQEHASQNTTPYTNVLYPNIRNIHRVQILYEPQLCY